MATLVLGELRESLSMALNAIMAHKLRSALTLLGVLIGVFSIIVVMTAMRVLERNIENNLSELGSQTFAIQKWPQVQFGNSSDWEKYWRRKDITIEQGQTVVAKSHARRRRRRRRHLLGRPNLDPLRQDRPQRPVARRHARQFLRAQLDSLTRAACLTTATWTATRSVCVLGSALAKTVFPFGSALGQQLKINGINYAVVGVLAPKGGSVGGNQDNFAVIPLTTALHRYGLRWRGLSIMVQARSAAVYADCEEQVRGILRDARKVHPGDPDDFEMFSNDSLIDQFKTFTRAVRIGVTVVSSIALLAAGVGIMNIMLVSVTERTREIGVRRAIGAKRRNIMAQFIMEAVVLCEVGGVIGVGARHSGRQRPRVVHESAARRPGGLDCAGAGAVLRRGNCVWNLSRVESREPRPD